jgi:hypothetical protein
MAILGRADVPHSGHTADAVGSLRHPRESISRTGRKPMKSIGVAFAAVGVASLLVANSVNAASKDTQKTPAAQASNTHQDAMYACEAMYAGNRGYLGKDRYAYIERCFKDKTGKYPFEVNQNCSLRRC